MAQLGNPFQAARQSQGSSTFYILAFKTKPIWKLVTCCSPDFGDTKKKTTPKSPHFPPSSQSPSLCDMDRFKLPSVCFVAKCVTVQCGAKPVSVKGLYQEVSSLAIANLTVYPHTQHDSNKWRLKGQRCLSEKQHECMNWIGFFQDPSGGSLAFLGVRSQCHCFQLQKMKW